jgi:hypothetical protein
MVAGYYPSQPGYIETDNKKWREMMASSYSLKKVSYCAMDILIYRGMEWMFSIVACEVWLCSYVLNLNSK